MPRRRVIGKEIVFLDNERLVKHYFNLISQKDVQGLLDLFADDAVVHEPFSNVEGGLKGKSAIEHFLKVVVMANAGFQRTIEFADKKQDSITAYVTFERGDSIKGKFSFTFVLTDAGKKIMTFTIRFKDF